MDKDLVVKTISINDIATQRLEGISNKIDFVASTTDDRIFRRRIKEILEIQKEISKFLESLI